MHKGIKRSLWGVSAGVVIGAAGLGAWWGTLLQRTRVLFAQSRQFSTDYVVGRGKGRGTVYLVMGDSTAVGTGASSLKSSYPYEVAMNLAASGAPVHVKNVAVSGARVMDVLRDQAPQIAKINPDYITLSVGANDSTHFTPLNEYAATWRRLLIDLDRSHAHVFVANSPDMAVVPALPPGIAQLIANRASQQNKTLLPILSASKAVLVDLFHQGKLDPNVDNHFYAADKFHPADRGYAVWAGVFNQAINHLAINHPAINHKP